MSLTDSLRKRVAERTGLCPTCGQPTNEGDVRALAADIGIPHTVLWRFLKGHDATGRTLDTIDAWLSTPDSTGARE